MPRVRSGRSSRFAGPGHTEAGLSEVSATAIDLLPAHVDSYEVQCGENSNVTENCNVVPMWIARIAIESRRRYLDLRPDEDTSALSVLITLTQK